MSPMMTETIQSIEELSAVAGNILDAITQKDSAQVFALSGDLGAGKTAFVKELAKHLHIAHEITSPTFVIMKSYPILNHPFLKTLTHIDAYRVEENDEMRVLGFQELCSDPTQLICIEWPKLIADLIPKDAYHITLTITDGDNRTITHG